MLSISGFKYKIKANSRNGTKKKKSRKFQNILNFFCVVYLVRILRQYMRTGHVNVSHSFQIRKHLDADQSRRVNNGIDALKSSQNIVEISNIALHRSYRHCFTVTCKKGTG